ncbi:PREDICTED: uncharacterized protein LOC107355200, partial [Acropora digitifera]|uniref:uncharacterized protein LOC107355200 n=1 Tax=Acropora digitifera TaxID=70779 RepID=UPI00077AFC57
MRPREKQLIEKRLKDFMEEVLPVDLFPFLPCLIQQDKEEIAAVQTNHGPTRATQTLVERLKRRDKGFANFVQALRKCGGAHTALLLDPFYMINDDDEDDDVTVADGSGLTYKMIGTAIDLAIPGNLMPVGACSEEQTEECYRLEESVAERYKDRKSDDNKRMRGELQKVSSRT